MARSKWVCGKFMGDGTMVKRSRQPAPSRLLLFDVNAKSQDILGEKEVTVKENDHVTSRNA
jgi:hypothetical protein